MDSSSPYTASYDITHQGFGSCVVYHIKPGGHDKKHYHDAIEIEYVVSGNCKTHTQGQVYLRQKGDVHECINDSTEELVLVCLTIPPESEKNTFYV